MLLLGKYNRPKSTTRQRNPGITQHSWDIQLRKPYGLKRKEILPCTFFIFLEERYFLSYFKWEYKGWLPCRGQVAADGNLTKQRSQLWQRPTRLFETAHSCKAAMESTTSCGPLWVLAEYDGSFWGSTQSGHAGRGTPWLGGEQSPLLHAAGTSGGDYECIFYVAWQIAMSWKR